MALVRNLYVGHFIPEEGYIRHNGHQPVVSRPINMDAVARLLKKHFGDAALPETASAEWGVTISPEYIVCDAGAARPVLDFAADYAEKENATVLDLGSFSLATPEELRHH